MADKLPYVPPPGGGGTWTIRLVPKAPRVERVPTWVLMINVVCEVDDETKATELGERLAGILKDQHRAEGVENVILSEVVEVEEDW